MSAYAEVCWSPDDKSQHSQHNQFGACCAWQVAFQQSKHTAHLASPFTWMQGDGQQARLKAAPVVAAKTILLQHPASRGKLTMEGEGADKLMMQ